MSGSGDWLYYKLYVGQRYDALDYVVVDILESLQTLLSEYQWFYLRYFDEKGIHLRLRIKLPAEQLSRETDIFSSLHDGMTELDVAPYNSYTPLISISGEAELPFSAQRYSAFCEKAEYEPEFENFGGKDGVVIAEDVFHRSSILARHIISLERQGELNRKDLVLPLFIIGLGVFIHPGNWQTFLSRYATFWLSGNPAIGSLKMAFAEQAYNLLDAGDVLVSPMSEYSEKQQKILQEWHVALKLARDAYAKKSAQLAKDIVEKLGFHFIHLMNNRLGFNALEEAYLATLLNTAEESGYHYEFA